jgi:hypothetical protein
MTSGNAPAFPERSLEGKKQRFWGDLVPPEGPDAGDADGYTPTAGAVCSSLFRAMELIPLAEDGVKCSPGMVWPLRFHSIGTVHARGMDGNCEYWPHRSHAGSHRPRDGLHVGGARSQRGNAGSHQVGEERRPR